MKYKKRKILLLKNTCLQVHSRFSFLSNLLSIYTVTTNPAGIPALALPCGFTKDNLPVGMQLQGPMFSESLLLRLGYHYQQTTDWHTRKPPIFR